MMKKFTVAVALFVGVMGAGTALAKKGAAAKPAMDNCSLCQTYKDMSGKFTAMGCKMAGKETATGVAMLITGKNGAEIKPVHDEMESAMKAADPAKLCPMHKGMMEAMKTGKIHHEDIVGDGGFVCMDSSTDAKSIKMLHAMMAKPEPKR